MNKLKLFLFALAVALAIAPAAKADTFYFNFGGAGDSGSGSLTGNSLTGNLFDVVGGSITIDGLTATVIGNPSPGNVSKSPDTLFDYDNVLNMGAGMALDSVGGILFELSNGNELEIWSEGNSFYVNVWNPTTQQWEFDPYDYPYGDQTAFNVSTTPEPSSLLLLGTGLLVMAGVISRKARTRNLGSSSIQTS